MKETKEMEKKHFEISLCGDDQEIKKVTEENNTMPSWVLGEEIARKLKQGQLKISINLTDIFARYRV